MWNRNILNIFFINFYGQDHRRVTVLFDDFFQRHYPDGLVENFLRVDWQDAEDARDELEAGRDKMNQLEMRLQQLEMEQQQTHLNAQVR